MGAWIETAMKYLHPLFLGVSRPAWARGLKLVTVKACPALFFVAPRMGAWIETAYCKLQCVELISRAPHGRVD